MFVPPKKTIGPSQISSILGFNKFCDRETLKDRLLHGYHAEQRECMDFGIRKEGVAKVFYQRYKGCRVISPDFARDPTGMLIGKADGLIGTDGGVEFKCHPDKDPLNGVPNYYLCQVVAYMWLYRRSWWDFVSCGFEGDQLTKCNITRIHWKNHKATWENEWYPQIMSFMGDLRSP